MSIMDLLLFQNPWWEGGESPLLKEWRSREIKWRPEWLNSLGLKPFSLNFVIGPRLVGKTTGLHLLINELLEEGEDPRSILYLNLDLAADLNAFRTMLHEYLEMRSSLGIKTSYLFLDEVTSLNGWWRVIKGYVDAGAFARDVLVLTGSSSLRLKGKVELFPGRMGAGRELTAWPLSFRQYLSVMKVKIDRSDNPLRNMKKLIPISSKIKRNFREYLKTGGYPLPINRDPRSMEYSIRSLEGEILRAGRDLGIAKAIISSILNKALSPLLFLHWKRYFNISQNCKGIYRSA